MEVGQTGGGRATKMDPKIVQEVLDLKLHNKYPEGLTSMEKS